MPRKGYTQIYTNILLQPEHVTFSSLASPAAPWPRYFNLPLMIFDSHSNMVRGALPLSFRKPDGVCKVNYTDNPPAYEYIDEQGSNDSAWTFVPCRMYPNGHKMSNHLAQLTSGPNPRRNRLHLRQSCPSTLRRFLSCPSLESITIIILPLGRIWHRSCPQITPR